MTILIMNAAGLVVLLAALVGVVWFFLRKLRQQAQVSRQLESEIKALRGAISAVCAQDSRQEQWRTEIEQRVRLLADQQEHLILRDPEQGPYEHAMRLVQRGANHDELMDACGLTRGEADLLLSLYQTRDQAARRRPVGQRSVARGRGESRF